MSQKSVFPFLCLKYAACSFIAGKTCSGFFAVKLGCFTVLLHRKKVVYQFAASHFDFYLISLKTTFPFIFLVIFKLRCFQYYVCKNNLFLFFVPKLLF